MITQAKSSIKFKRLKNEEGSKNKKLVPTDSPIVAKTRFFKCFSLSVNIFDSVLFGLLLISSFKFFRH